MSAQLTSNDIKWPLFIAEWLKSLEKTWDHDVLLTRMILGESQNRVLVLTDDFINIYDGLS